MLLNLISSNIQFLINPFPTWYNLNTLLIEGLRKCLLQKKNFCQNKEKHTKAKGDYDITQHVIGSGLI